MSAPAEKVAPTSGASAQGSGKGFVDWLNKKRVYLWRRYRKAVDDFSPFVLQRWIFALFLMAVLTIRILSVQGFYVVAYAYGIFFLNQFVGFLSPKIEPEDGTLPTSMTIDDEYRPFVRYIPEKVFWERTVQSTLIALLCTFVPFLDIPVFWPILLIYFISLTFITLKNQIMHMIKYKYLPWNYNKRRYNTN